MRDSPLILQVAWGKGRIELMNIWQIRKNQGVSYPQKREKPRGNGASRGNKR